MCAVAFADSLPKTAIPMNAESVKKMYSGNSAIWKDSDVYFLPDGSVQGVFGKPTVTDLIVGSWSVSGNEICVYTFQTKQPTPFRDCYQYWRDGKRIIALWSIHADGSAVDSNNGYHSGEDRLKPGDLVSDKYQAASSK
jgi:hypothetical protein